MTIEAKRMALLRRRLAERELADGASTIPTRTEPDRAPLSFAQRRMWLHQQVNPGDSAYNVSILLRLSGPVDRDALEAALRTVVATHEILRTTYHTDPDGFPYQWIHQELPTRLRYTDLANAAEREPRLAELASVEAAEPFELDREGPIRFHILRLADTETAVLLSLHHIIWDGLSFAALSTTLTAAYRGTADTPPTPQYADFAEWEQRNWSDEQHAAELEYWRGRLLPAPDSSALPNARTLSRAEYERAERLDLRLPGHCAPGLRALARTGRTTVFNAYLACYLLVLHRYSGAEDIRIGTMAMNREHPGLAALIGNFGNTLALRFDLSGNPEFGELLDRVRHTCESAYRHQDYPFELLAERLREPGAPALFESLALLLAGEVTGPELPGVSASWRTVFHGSSPFPLSCQGFLSEDTLDMEVTYAAGLFDRATVHGMLATFGTLIGRAAADSTVRLDELTEPSPAERAAALTAGTGAALPGHRLVPETLRAVAERYPSAIALRCGERSYDYAELLSAAGEVTARLRELEAGPESVVAIAVPRSPELVFAILGVLCSGAAYLPVDTGYPAERIRFMLTDQAPEVVLSTGAVELPEVPARRIDLDRITPVPGQRPPAATVRAASIALIGYTSGSTGRPKAVLDTHAALAAKVAAAAREWPLEPGGSRLAKSSPTFIDGSTEILETLCAGGTVVLAGDTESRDGAALARLLGEHRIRHLMAVPSLLRAIAETPGAFCGMERVVCTGEALSAALATELGERVPAGALTNSYGCSEVAGDVIAGAVPDGSVPIGVPLPGVFAVLLDDRLRPVPEGIAGELYLGGPQLARGYGGDPALTASRFVANPFHAGQRLYRTGDHARWTAGRLEFLGRDDEQVKVRGHRVELGELAAIARTAPEVEDAVAVARGTNALGLYVTPAGLDTERLRGFLERELPGYLVPATILAVPAFPLLPNGKVDRFALPAGTEPAAQPGGTARTPAERELCALAGELLGTPLGPEADFFAAGGDSISAISLAARARKAGFSFAVPDIFDRRTLAKLAAYRTVEPVPVALPAAAHRLRRSGTPLAEYTTWTWWRPGPRAGLAAVERAVRAVLTRHDALRLRVDTSRKTLWRAEITDGAGSWAHAEAGAGPVTALAGAACSRLDPGSGRMLHAVLATDGSALVLAGHALAVDHASLSVLRKEIETVLDGGALAGPGTGWPEPPAPGDPEPWLATLRPSDPVPERGNGEARGSCRVPFAVTEARAVAALLYAYRGWHGGEHAVAEHLVRHGPEDAVGPFTYRHPVAVSAQDSLAGLVSLVAQRAESAAGYEALRYASPRGARLFAELGEPRVLVTGETVPGSLRRDYPLIARFRDGRVDTGLELISEGGPGKDELAELLADWRAALER
ncbi:non-ribosomal peptide synthetase [Sciscionella marina]|uniref:non-ribosomal peptide synthetase n=1 Tax=Sciscionella marina TaxID=508770 RepID=UPI000375117E|nr:non-ribosomal peptide synthetase [Sciscionella marina]